MNLHKPLLFTSFLFNILQFCFSIDSITLNRTVKDGEVLVSSGQVFELGFFSPSNDTTNRYVGIWYHKVSEKRIVWVANRDAPVSDDSGVLTLTNHGLVLYEKNQTAPIWSTNVSNSASVAKLLDLGNLVLLGERTQEILWQSFDYPSDTLLPFMKLGLNKRTGLNQFLSSWKSNSDPGIGNVTYKIDPTGYPQLFLFRGLDPWWRGGPWTGLRWSGVPQMTKSFILNVSFVNNESEVSIEYGVTNASLVSIMYLDASSGLVKRSTWNEQDHQWFEFWSAPNEPCDSYGVCGPNGNCDPYDSDNFMCKCLPGFVPKSQRDWFLRDGKQGCVRKPGLSTCRSGEGFVKLVRVKLPDTSTAWVDNRLTLKQCGEDCLKNCSCTAYTSADERGLGCLRWFGDLNDTRTYSKLGQDLYLRVDANELAKYAKEKGPLANQGIQAIVIVSIVLTICIIVGVVYYLIRRRKRRSSSLRDKNLPFSFRSSSYLADSPSTQGRNTELPIFDLSVIASATNNFSEDNKLGEGGFGSVYKGKLHNGQEIAVKRLAKYSGQGTQEFKNEVTLISKLQHRNLVKMLGCCVQGHEKMLIYEFLPNKSLDFFIFDETKRSLLDWPTRYKILCGVARGILYLHEDSRLKIIHRDLKASNVLLDVSMNPKISDFGMARIFGVDQMEANTNRVVGTYGYMSPEYAMQGLFSIKSDVYSFGVLLLEIVSGKKNSKYYEEKTSSNLVGHVWNLWKEGRALEIVDTTMGDSYSEQEVWRCIQIGLLCVQESANDRPNMSAVVFMLSNNDTVLQSPNQPAFILKTRNYTSGDPSTSGGASSVNDVTVSMLEAR